MISPIFIGAYLMIAIDGGYQLNRPQEDKGMPKINNQSIHSRNIDSYAMGRAIPGKLYHIV